MGVVHYVLIQISEGRTHPVLQAVRAGCGLRELETVPPGATGVLDTLLFGNGIYSLKVSYKGRSKVDVQNRVITD